MKTLILILTLLFFTGCQETKEYREFVDKYHSETRTFCQDGFLMRETFVSPMASKPEQALINSDVCYK